MKKISQSSKKWFTNRRFRITSSNLSRILKLSSDVKSILDPEPFTNSFDTCSTIETAIKCFFGYSIFSTGLWIHDQYNWLATSPDGFIEINSEILPLEIKAIIAKKNPREVMIEYYLQFQLHMEITKSSKLVFFLYNRNEEKLCAFILKKDTVYLNHILARAEKIYFETIPFLILKEVSEEGITDLCKSEKYLKRWLKLQKKIDENENELSKKISKKLIFEKIDLNYKNIPFSQEETVLHYMKKTFRISSKKFVSNYSSWMTMKKEEQVEVNETVMLQTLKALEKQFR